MAFLRAAAPFIRRPPKSSSAAGKFPMAMKKQEKLFQILTRLNRVVVCFSGGLDSTYLLWAAKQVLGKADVLALTAASPDFGKDTRREIAVLAASLDVRHQWLETEEFKSPNHIVTSVSHCFFCKDELYSKAVRIGDNHGMAVLDGFQFSDAAENLPGYESAKKWGVRHPLEDAGLHKEEIQFLAQKAGLPLPVPRHKEPDLRPSLIEMPAAELDKARHRAETGEAYLRKIGFRFAKVIPLGTEDASIEAGPKEIFLAAAQSARIRSYFSGLGFRWVYLNLSKSSQDDHAQPVVK